MATTIETKLKQEALLAVIANELQDLPPLPAVIVRVMQTINDPRTSAQDLNRLISADQAITSKILRLVNSSYYGFPRKVSTVTDAVVILGFNTVRDLTTSIGAFNAFRARRGSTALDREMFWAHSIAVGVAAGVIGRQKKLSSKAQEELFVGGLMHDIGKLFLDQFFPDQYAIVLKLALAANISIWESEKKALGVGHALVSKRIAEKWNLPPTLTAMIALHHQPTSAGEHVQIAAVIHAADIVARRLALGNGGDRMIPTMAPEVEKWLGFGPQAWEAIDGETKRKFQDCQEFLKMAAG
ncbi:HD family phosphohydrolase [Capsulimonas corticalis]|uniref:HD family phosphohydrolase n=1 Tax=Capsulimonas corticalis TaxID=2219043 RepID=A0A402CV86_9BACT|nr:HDOD domain-containing protein [Capsulimonas corticalis]BDI30315.1 HD family phosphohydrolase [Capsulimonas corticalis]